MKTQLSYILVSLSSSVQLQVVQHTINMKTVTLLVLVHAGLFGCFHKPPNSEVDCRIFNVRVWFIFYIISVCRTFQPFVESAQNLTLTVILVSLVL